MSDRMNRGWGGRRVKRERKGKEREGVTTHRISYYNQIPVPVPVLEDSNTGNSWEEGRWMAEVVQVD